MAYLRDPQFKAAKDVLAKRKDSFNALNAEARDNDAWIISVAGAKEVIIECLPTSAWPDALRERGYRLEALEDGQRILPFAIHEPMTTRHAGIVRVLRYSFNCP